MLSATLANSPSGELNLSHSGHPRINALNIEHDDLDAAIDALAAANTHDDQVIARLKKRRLRIRDEIAGILAAPGGSQNDAAMDASTPDAMETEAPIQRRRGGGSFVFALMFLIALTLGLGWSGIDDSLNQTLAQLYVLSLVAAANG